MIREMSGLLGKGKERKGKERDGEGKKREGRRMVVKWGSERWTSNLDLPL